MRETPSPRKIDTEEEGPVTSSRREILRAGLGLAAFVAAGPVLATGAEAAEAPGSRYTPFKMLVAGELKRGEQATLHEGDMEKVSDAWRKNYETRPESDSLNKALDRIKPHETDMLAAFTKENVPTQYMYLSIVETWFEDLKSPMHARGQFQFLKESARQYGLVVTDHEKPVEHDVGAKETLASIAHHYHVPIEYLESANHLEKDAKLKPKQKLHIPAIDERTDPVKSAGACARHLRHLHEGIRAKGVDDALAWRFAVSSYNGSFAWRYVQETGDTPPTYAGFLKHLQERIEHRLHADPGKEQSYTVSRHDTLPKIAKRHKVPLEKLLERNELKKDAVIHLGQTLVIPPSEQGSAVTFQVSKGDTLQIIADYIGTTVKELEAVNKLDPKKLKHGLKADTMLLVPTSAKQYENLRVDDLIDRISGLCENGEYLLKYEGLIAAMKEKKLGIFKE